METVYNEELPVLERIKFPMVWERLACGFRVEDLLPEKFDEALDIARDHFIEDDPMCKGCNLTKEEDSVKEFLELIRFYMQSSQSFAAVEESSGDIVGLLVGKVNELPGRTQIMSRTRIYQSEVLGKMQRFQSHIQKQVDVYSLFNTEAFYKVYVWCVVRDYRDRGIGKALLRTAVEQTCQFKMASVAGVFTGAISQHVASSMGFSSHLEILYWQWKEGEEPVFDNPGPGNNSAVLMVKDVRDQLPVEDTVEDQAKD